MRPWFRKVAGIGLLVTLVGCAGAVAAGRDQGPATGKGPGAGVGILPEEWTGDAHRQCRRAGPAGTDAARASVPLRQGEVGHRAPECGRNRRGAATGVSPGRLPGGDRGLLGTRRRQGGSPAPARPRRRGPGPRPRRRPRGRRRALLASGRAGAPALPNRWSSSQTKSGGSRPPVTTSGRPDEPGARDRSPSRRTLTSTAPWVSPGAAQIRRGLAARRPPRVAVNAESTLLIASPCWPAPGRGAVPVPCKTQFGPVGRGVGRGAGGSMMPSRRVARHESAALLEKDANRERHGGGPPRMRLIRPGPWCPIPSRQGCPGRGRTATLRKPALERPWEAFREGSVYVVRRVGGAIPASGRPSPTRARSRPCASISPTPRPW